VLLVVKENLHIPLTSKKNPKISSYTQQETKEFVNRIKLFVPPNEQKPKLIQILGAYRFTRSVLAHDLYCIINIILPSLF
jgi:hypothetical protein